MAFLQEFLKHPLQVGSIIPSSRFLERRLVELGEVRSAGTIVELGPGTGGTTRAMLGAMAPHARLLSIEINPDLHAMVSRIADARFIPHHGSADRLPETLSMYGLAAPDVVVSGIPFSTMSPATGARVLEGIAAVLAPGGRFVAYQVSSRVDSLCRPILGPARVHTELFNLPPLRIYRWEKETGSPQPG
jgi:phospholipid N-methyltransferase